MSEELRPCPFCGNEPQEITTNGKPLVVCWCRGCVNDPKNWNTRPIEDALNARIAELEGIVKADNLRLINAGLSTGLYSGCDTAEMMAEEILASRARIAELEAEVTKCHELQDSYCDRIAELEGLVDKLIEVGDALESQAYVAWRKYGMLDFPAAETWCALVKDWKEREE